MPEPSPKTPIDAHARADWRVGNGLRQPEQGRAAARDGLSGHNAFMQNSGHCDRAGAGGYNETTFLESMDALNRTGLQKLKYVYINADDCWIAENRTAEES